MAPESRVKSSASTKPDPGNAASSTKSTFTISVCCGIDADPSGEAEPFFSYTRDVPPELEEDLAQRLAAIIRETKSKYRRKDRPYQSLNSLWKKGGSSRSRITAVYTKNVQELIDTQLLTFETERWMVRASHVSVEEQQREFEKGPKDTESTARRVGFKDMVDTLV
ncbi:hypothetical protein EHS25_002881 [Saitozyma podzolica]|uniref:Uncharacterized protein n=1 Tax=Saitozyma podzolica TaxID=1890683 RepID=A0A427YCG6_9TREE|nr:hypothetical protein EHS25_002881 [Saitozyma podzolica]